MHIRVAARDRLDGRCLHMPGLGDRLPRIRLKG